jgi:copper transport protein
LLVKLLGVGLLVALGYLARVWIAHYLTGWIGAQPRPGAGRSVAGAPDAVALRQLRRSTGLEVAIATGVLAITAMLVNAQPARSAYAAPLSTTAAFDTGGPDGKGSVQVFISPARPGTDTVHLEAASLSGTPRAVAQLTASLSLPDRQLGPLPVTLTADGSGHYLGTATIPLPGAWKLAVTVRTDAIDETTVTIPVTIR